MLVVTFRGQTQALDIVRLRFFPFSLKDKAKVLYSLRPRYIKTWDDMIKAFFHKYNPNHKIRTYGIHYNSLHLDPESLQVSNIPR